MQSAPQAAAGWRKGLHPDGAVCPGLCITRKILGGGSRKKAGVRHPVKSTLSLADQMALQMVKISLLSAHTCPTG